MSRWILGEMVVTWWEEVVNFECISKEELTEFPKASVGVSEGADNKAGSLESRAAL